MGNTYLIQTKKRGKIDLKLFEFNFYLDNEQTDYCFLNAFFKLFRFRFRKGDIIEF